MKKAKMFCAKRLQLVASMLKNHNKITKLLEKNVRLFNRLQYRGIKSVAYIHEKLVVHNVHP